MRLDRFITLNIVQPFRRVFRNGDNDAPWPVPVLMYHNITDEPEPGVSPYYKVNTTPAVFRQHMAFLAEQGYKTITVSALAEAMSQKSPLPTVNSQLVAITFDDGFRSFYTEAFPVLKEFGFTATMFLATGFISEEGARKVFQPAGSRVSNRHTNGASACMQCLTWNEIREMSAAGIEFGSHTVTHPKLVDLDEASIRREIHESKAIIEQKIQKPANAFCYPYAFPSENKRFTAILEKDLQEAGIRACATTMLGKVGKPDPLLRLRRIPANAMDDDALLRAKLAGNYDWLSKCQRLKKMLGNSRRSLKTEANEMVGCGR